MSESTNSIFGVRRADAHHLIEHGNKRKEWWLNVGYAEEIELRDLDRYLRVRRHSTALHK
ncbi:MAG: hypothetical protein ACPHN3_00820 [Spongiibacter sp.]|uniref:Uncharacterized protein n=1 Tax=Spongiibacter thalassae TaxID=2721624 RepID=A0ABX1GGT2_9GAMM|nr:hypothetical protein [Spongiibacter thalassae]NKI18136.1 hypothetical protein [Spongiibacter thalassae]